MTALLGCMEAFKYRGEKLIGLATGHDFDRTMAQTTMIGIQEDERVEMTAIRSTDPVL